MSRSLPIASIPFTMPVGGLTWGQLQEGLRAVIRAERQAEQAAELDGMARLSLNRAAKVARTRPATLQQALMCGVLPGRKDGRRWSVMAADLDAWVRAGRQVVEPRP